jgi:UDP-glucose 4-epimerase
MHFAAYCYVGESVTDPLKYYLNNSRRDPAPAERHDRVGGEEVRLLLHLRDLRGPGPAAHHRDLPQAPINPYGQTKLDIERALKALARPTA